MAFTERMIRGAHVPSPLAPFRMVAIWLRRRERRAQVAELLERDEATLADIGVTRDDVRAALACRGDAGTTLRRIARARRAARHARRPI